jgi:signal transduction histidine kinase
MFATSPNTVAPRLGIEPLRLFLQEWDLPGYWRSRLLPCSLLLLGYAICHATLVAIGYKLSFEAGSILAIWPSTGLLAAMLALTPYRIWPLWLAGAFIGRLSAEALLPSGAGLGIALGYALNNCLEASVFGWLFRRPLDLSYRLGRPLYGMAALCISALIGTTMGGLQVMAVAALDITGSPQVLWNYWRTWIIADYLAIIQITPLMAWLLLPQTRDRWLQRSTAELLYYCALAILVAALSVYFAPQDDSVSSRATRAALSVIIMLPMLWAALRFPYPVIGISLLLFSVGSIVGATRGIGPLSFGPDDIVAGMAALQAHVLTVVQFGILIAFAVRERHRAIVDVEQNRRFRSLVLTLSDKLVAAGADEVEFRIDEVLGDLGDFTSADRVILVQLNHELQQVASMHRWNRATVPQQTLDMTGRPLSEFSNVMRYIEKKGYVSLQDIRHGFGTLPDAVARELEPIFNVTGSTQSAIHIGLFASGRLIGVVGCSWVKPGVWWSNESLSLLYLLGQLLANVLQRKAVERALQNYQDRLRSMATEVSLSEERARRRAAIDLHDGIGQNLAVARMRIGQILATHSERSDQWQVARDLIDQALLGTRHVISDLSPAILYELGLVPAIQSLAENFKLRHSIDSEVLQSGEPWIPTEDQKVMLHRSVRELLNNVARHAMASAVTINIDWADDQLSLRVADDGVGMTAPLDNDLLLSTGRGFGLFSVREAVIEADGQFAIDSAAGIGTSVKLSVPRVHVQAIAAGSP